VAWWGNGCWRWRGKGVRENRFNIKASNLLARVREPQAPPNPQGHQLDAGCCRARTDYHPVLLQISGLRSITILCLTAKTPIPAHGIEEGIQAAWRIEAHRFRQRERLVDARPQLQFPDHLQLFAERVILDGSQRHPMLRRAIIEQFRYRQRAACHLRDNLAALPHFDELALFGE